MAHKVNEIIDNRLLDIRTEIGITQKEMGQVLGVSERMICNYETKSSNLPIDKALILSDKYGYTLDDIYCRQNSNYHFNNKFNIDIQKLITCDENNIYLTFYKDFWEYIHEIVTINNSHDTESTKKTKILELAAKYNNEKSDIIFQISIPKEKINSYIRVDDELFPYCDDNDLRKEKSVPTDEQVREIIDFLESLQ